MIPRDLKSMPVNTPDGIPAPSVKRRLHDFHFPNESAEYREARDALLRSEIALRDQIESVAAQRRALPLGGRIAQDYVFQAENGAVSLSQLFGSHDTLVTYNMMFSSEMERPCPACTSLLSAVAGEAHEIAERVSFVVIAKSSFERIKEFARERRWDNLQLISSTENSFNRDYRGETSDGSQIPEFNVFARKRDGIYHTYGGELFLVDSKPGQEPRAVDLMWPFWNLLDLTPSGRGAGWAPDPNDGSVLRYG